MRRSNAPDTSVPGSARGGLTLALKASAKGSAALRLVEVASLSGTEREGLEAGATQMDETKPQTPLRILLVEDDEDTRALTSDLIRSTTAHSVTLAATAESGLAQLRTGRFDLLITDIGLPGISGLEMLDQAEQEGLLSSATTVVVCSGAHTCDRDGVRFLKKPVDAETLSEILEACVERDDRFSEPAA